MQQACLDDLVQNRNFEVRLQEKFSDDPSKKAICFRCCYTVKH